MTDEQRARIDAAVAEHVMGMRVSPWSIHPNEKPVAAYAAEEVGVAWRPTVGFAFVTDDDHVPPEVLLPDNDGDMPGWEAFDGTSWKGVPAFSTTWEGMGLVVERMDELGMHCRIQTPFEPDMRYHAGFTPHSVTGWNGRPDHADSADTAPLAVCLAALKAKGIDVAALVGGET